MFKILPSIAMTLVVASTMSISGIAAYKLSKVIPPVDSIMGSVLGTADQNDVNSSNQDSNNLFSFFNKDDEINNENEEKRKGSLSGLINNASATTKNGSAGCIVSISGKQYDVTRLKTSHSGGDIFKCNTDMTASYNSIHGSNVSRMTAYLVTGRTNIPVANINNGGTTNPNVQNNGTTNNPSTSGQCIVTISGKSYNVTALANSHSGPRSSFFRCGSDMTATYTSKHGNSTALISYLAVPTTNTNKPIATNPNVNNGGTTNPNVQNNGTTNNPSTSGQCIVTISGKSYNVTALANSHSGPRGSFFRCGSDMTATYTSKHGNSTALISYLIVNTNNGGGPVVTPQNGGNNNPIPNNNPVPNNGGANNWDDDDDDNNDDREDGNKREDEDERDDD